MADTDPTTIDDFAPETTSETVTRTIKFGLETSQTKNEQVRTGIEDFQRMAGYMADIVPTYPEHEWTPNHTGMYRRITDEFPKDDREVKATIAREAQQKVVEAYRSWRQRGKDGDRPHGRFGDGNWMRLSHQDLEIVRNKRGFGLKASFIPYNPVWFHIVAGEFQRRFLDRIVDEDDDASAGAAELRLSEDGGLTCHLTVSWEVEVYEPEDTQTAVGVDLGENTLYALAVLGSTGVETVEMERGREYRHHRERLKKKRSEAMERGDLKAVRDTRYTYQKYTDHITNVASRAIVDTAVEHRPAVIHLEDLTYYRDTASEPIHDWPFAEIQEKIAYKATGEGIPVRIVDPSETSITCRKCGDASDEKRDGNTFYCRRCDYEVHADVNAAINIAQRTE